MDRSFYFRLTQAFKQYTGFKLAVFYLVAILFLILLLPVLPLTFPPAFLDLANPYLSPFSEEAKATGHWLGTDQLGRDVLANLLYGFRTGFLIALPVIIIALLLGTMLGSAAGFWGNRQFRIAKTALIGFLIWLPAVFFYVFYLQPFYQARNNFNNGSSGIFLPFLIFIGLTISIFGVACLLRKVGIGGKKVALPVDELVLKSMEVLSSVPRLVLILSFSAVAAPGVSKVLLLLSLTYWAGPARLIRAEVLKIKQLPYIEAARVSGLSDRRILMRHILPNAAGPLWVAFSFGLSSLLGLEATLSFLGIGLPPEMPSWGRMLAGARANADAWWLILFPAIALCLTILSIQACGNYLQKSTNSNSK